MREKIYAAVLTAVIFIGGSNLLKIMSGEAGGPLYATDPGEQHMIQKTEKSESEWRAVLDPKRFHVLRESGTEPRFSGKYNDFDKDGIYVCGACEAPLFDSESKYEHNTGWPSYTVPINSQAVTFHLDKSFFGENIEVRCASCGSHLGHVFNDGPPPTGKHYCINSLSLDFKPRDPANREEKEVIPETATLAAGCFWGVEDKLSRIEGVLSTQTGYSGGDVPRPKYRQVCRGNTGHAEAVEVKFDPAVLSYENLLRIFFQLHDPTQRNRQGPDLGTQYRSVIFTHDETQRQIAENVIRELERSDRYNRPITTQIVPASEFYEAEEYHQDFYEKRRKRLF